MRNNQSSEVIVKHDVARAPSPVRQGRDGLATSYIHDFAITSSSNPVRTGFFHKLICGALAVLTSICASAESRHFGYWLHGKTMKDVDVPALVSLETTDVILHEHAFTAHGQKDV